MVTSNFSKWLDLFFCTNPIEPCVGYPTFLKAPTTDWVVQILLFVVIISLYWKTLLTFIKQYILKCTHCNTTIYVEPTFDKAIPYDSTIPQAINPSYPTHQCEDCKALLAKKEWCFASTTQIPLRYIHDVCVRSIENPYILDFVRRTEGEILCQNTYGVEKNTKLLILDVAIRGYTAAKAITIALFEEQQQMTTKVYRQLLKSPENDSKDKRSFLINHTFVIECAEDITSRQLTLRIGPSDCSTLFVEDFNVRALDGLNNHLGVILPVS